MVHELCEMLGQPLWFLRSTMPKTEFIKWMRYMHHKPPSINEQQMAVLSTIVVSALGSKKAKMSDFLISKQQKSNKSTPMDASSIRGAFGGVANTKT